MPQPKRRRTQQRSEGVPAAGDEGADRCGLALVASAIDEIAQAARNKDLAREREELKAVLRDWRESYRRLEERARSLRAAYDQVAAQLEQTERERQEWHMKYLACERELKEWSPSPASTRGPKR